MNRLAHAVTGHPVRVLLVWLAAVAAVVALTSPGGIAGQADVMKSNQADFLPSRYESVRAAKLLSRAFPQPDGATSTIVIHRAGHRPLTAGDVARARGLARRLARGDGVRAVVVGSGGLSPNHRVLLGSVLMRRTLFDPLLSRDVNALRDRTDAVFARAGLAAGYAGQAATQVDASARAGVTSLLTMVVIAVLLLGLFRSVVIAVLDVVLVFLVGAAATGLIFIGAKLLGFPLDTNVTGLLPIIVLGVGTDYVVFLLHRYRERLRAGDPPREAMRHAISRIGPAIGFSALTVVVSLSALGLSSLKSLKVLGPALGFGVLATLVAALTLVPAVAVLLRHRLFWPGRTLSRHSAPRSTRTERLVTGRPIGAALAAAFVLAALALPALGFKPDYDVQATVPGSRSAEAFVAMRAGFPKGALDPTTVEVHRRGAGRLTRADVAPVSAALRATRGVGDVRPAAVSRDGRTARIDALLVSPPFTNTALDTMDHRIRPAVHAATEPGTTAEVGGNTSAYADVRDAIGHDQTLIFPVAALLVGGILVLLLRSLAVPALVMTGVVTGFVATLGASVAAFQGIGGKAGLFYQQPLIVYLFVASMTSDYAILVLTRVREELRAGRSPRDAVAVALRTAGPSVAAAGIVLAGSFAVLVISPALAQVGFSVAVGILLSALVSARVLIPALTLIGGRRAWWPARLGRGRAGRAGTPAQPEPA